MVVPIPFQSFTSSSMLLLSPPPPRQRPRTRKSLVSFLQRRHFLILLLLMIGFVIFVFLFGNGGSIRYPFESLRHDDEKDHHSSSSSFSSYNTNNRIHREMENDTIRMSTFLHEVRMTSTTNTTTTTTRPNTVLTYEGRSQLDTLTKPWFTWDRNPFCETIRKIRRQQKKQEEHPTIITVNITFGCHDLFQNGHVGTGNYMAFFYGIRFSARVLGNVELYLTCHDAVSTRHTLILPWLTGYFPATTLSSTTTTTTTTTTFESHSPYQETYCADFRYLPLAYMYREMQHDLRRMAVALIGIPLSSSQEPRHPAHTWFVDTTTSTMTTSSSSSFQDEKENHHNSRPILFLPDPLPNDMPLLYRSPTSSSSPHFPVDDVAIHFRCGDFLSDAWDHLDTSTFAGYIQHIPTNGVIRTIGILTQPLDDISVISKSTEEKDSHAEQQQHRSDDTEPIVLKRCRVLVYSFVKFIQQHHPNAQIFIHNDRNETIALTYARMIMARQQSITGMTSFGEFATVATFGTGYVRHPSQWVKGIDILMAQDHMNDNHSSSSSSSLSSPVVLYQPFQVQPFKYIKALWNQTPNGTTAAMKWFWNGVLPTDGNYCGSDQHDNHHNYFHNGIPCDAFD